MSELIPNIGLAIVKRKQDESAILTPDSAREADIYAAVCEVVACAPPRPTPSGLGESYEYFPGEIVIANLYGGHMFKMDDIDYFAIDQKNIIASIKP